MPTSSGVSNSDGLVPVIGLESWPVTMANVNESGAGTRTAEMMSGITTPENSGDGRL
jgi:hypothetical protein